MTYQNPFDQSALRAATAANERALDALKLVQQPRTDQRWARLISEYSLAEAINDLCRENRRGVPAEVHAELVRRGQVAQQSNSVLVPYEAFAQRADIAGSATAGGYLIESLVLPVADALRPFTVAGALGATIIPLLSGGNISLPKVTGTATAYWLDSESTPITETDQTFGQVAFAPHTIGVYSELSRQLNLQAPGIRDVITRDHARLVGRAVDLAALYGSGLAGQPLGLTNVAGIGAFSAASLSIDALIAAQTSLGNGLTQSAGIAATLLNAGTMRERTEFPAGDATLWRGSLLSGTCAGLPARSSTALTPNQLILGSWEFLNIVLWGALEVSVNPYDRANFQSGVIGVRTFLSLDVGATWPAAFSIGSNFS